MSQEGWKGSWVCMKSGENDADSSNNTASEAILKCTSTPLSRKTLRLNQVKLSSGRQSQLQKGIIKLLLIVMGILCCSR